MIAVACGIFEKFGWQEYYNPRASIIRMQSLLLFFFKKKLRKLLIFSYHALLLSQKEITYPVFLKFFFPFLGVSWNNRKTEIAVEEDLSFCVCVIHINTMVYTVDTKFQE